MTGNRDAPAGPLDVVTLEQLGRRAVTHPLVADWMLEPDSLSPRKLVIRFDEGQYPTAIQRARIDIRWFEGGDYSVHYVETHGDDERWQCRWDRHDKPTAPRTHFHPPPNAEGVESSSRQAETHLDVLFVTLGWVGDRIGTLYEND